MLAECKGDAVRGRSRGQLLARRFIRFHAKLSTVYSRPETAMPLTLTSSAFEPNGPIPPIHTCDGRDISPPLSWSGVPPGAKSLALIVDDPDAPDPAAPQRTWVHWVLFNIPANAPGLESGGHKLPEGAVQGSNDWKRSGYGGPCPPIGRHRYFFKLYALDVVLAVSNPDKQQLVAAMQGHILEQTEIIGTYHKA
jgi:Raf kinase inhibitor-like YbhB/YbcL family protein